ncbi:MAG TPA: phospholipase, partial [Thermoanaerobaculia bacterium]
MLRRLALASILLLLGCRTVTRQETGFLNRSLTLGTTTYPYIVYLPRDYERQRSWPVILFLHGAGERSTDGIRQTAIGVANAIRLGPARVPAIV